MIEFQYIDFVVSMTLGLLIGIGFGLLVEFFKHVRG